MATVYRAEDTTLRRDVAVKVLHPHLAKRGEYRARFLREARAAAKLDHPGILRVHDVGEQDERAFIVMELLRGRSMKEFLDERGAPLAEVVAMIGATLADALSVAHRAGVIHRDLKPANVMVVDGGRLVLCDFGVARVVDDDAVVTQSGAMVGTPAFMSPEQALGKEADARSDVYSLGATLYQIATGHLPASGSTPAVLAAVSRGEIVPPLRKNPAIGVELAQVIAKAMSKDPAERFASAEEMRAALDEVAAAGGMEDRAVELREYFAEPGAWNERRLDGVLARTMQRARAAAERKQYARALAFADRVLALRPGDEAASSLLATVGKGARGWRAAKLAASALVVAGLAGVGAVAWIHRSGDERAAIDAGAGFVAVADAGGATHASGVANERPAAELDAGRAGMTEAVVVADRRLKPRARVDAGVGAAARNVDAGAPIAPAIDAGAAREEWGEIVVKVTPWCEISIDGEPRGKSPGAPALRVRAGTHTVTCEQRGTGLRLVEEIEVAAGETKTIQRRLLEPVRVKLSVSTSRLRVAGVTHPNGASIELFPSSVFVELLAGDRVSASAVVQVRQACTIRDTPELGCYE